MGFLSALRFEVMQCSTSDGSPPPYPIARTRQDLLDYIVTLEPLLRELYPHFQEQTEWPAYPDIRITNILSDLQDVKRLCTDENALEFYSLLSPILPHLVELKRLTSKPCSTINRDQLVYGDTYLRGLWLNLLREILSYDKKVDSETPYGFFGVKSKMKVYNHESQYTREESYQKTRRTLRNKLWPYGFFTRTCNCKENCVEKPKFGWP